MPDLIQWYPGHMAKARRLIKEQLEVVDAVIELCDARLPEGSRNPDIDFLLKEKPRLLVLTKADLANPDVTSRWTSHYAAKGIPAISFAAGKSKRAAEVTARLEDLVAKKVAAKRERGMNKTVRAMVVGIPNVGKSTLINALRGGAATRVADKPGVTRGKQWVSIKPYLDVLDTPGMLWPKLEDQQSALYLAFLGAIRDESMDIERLAVRFLEEVAHIAPGSVMERLRLSTMEKEGDALLEDACRARGWLMSGGRPDTLRGAQVLLDEFRAGRMGRITLETPGAAP